MSRPLYARIDLAALRHNYHTIKAHLATQQSAAKIWTVLKADAYGHGSLRVANALRTEADGFALLELETAIGLREQGFQQPILLLEGLFAGAELALCERYRLIPVVHQPEQLAMLRELKTPLPIYLKMNSGMNRMGLTMAHCQTIKDALAACPLLDSVTLMTHFACADDLHGIAAQLTQFERMRAALQGHFQAVSMANSAALLRYPQSHGDWVRPGIILYGGSPFADVSAEALGLRPVMTLESRIISIQELSAGEQVGYGATFTADKAMRIGTVACGYADGYSRHAPTGTPILIDGQRSRIVGRISMDLLACDLTDLPNAGLNSTVILWGEGLPADEVARAAKTISYELFCALARRVSVTEK